MKTAERVVIDKVVANYQHTRNGMKSDYHADYLARFGPCPNFIPSNAAPDRRDQRDPEEVGIEYLVSRGLASVSVTEISAGATPTLRRWHEDDGA